MKCFDCENGRLSRKRVKVPHEIRGCKFDVEDTVLVCNKCGAISIPWDRVNEHGRLVDETYRRLEGILTAEEIRAARERLQMSQRGFAEHLGVGEASVKRWERGVLPDKSSSDLIRLKTDVQAARQNWLRLKSLAGKHAALSVADRKKPPRRTTPVPAASARRSAAARLKG